LGGDQSMSKKTEYGELGPFCSTSFHQRFSEVAMHM
jgi:hypothetical protein